MPWLDPVRKRGQDTPSAVHLAAVGVLAADASDAQRLDPIPQWALDFLEELLG